MVHATMWAIQRRQRQKLSVWTVGLLQYAGIVQGAQGLHAVGDLQLGVVVVAALEAVDQGPIAGALYRLPLDLEAPVTRGGQVQATICALGALVCHCSAVHNVTWAPKSRCVRVTAGCKVDSTSATSSIQAG